MKILIISYHFFPENNPRAFRWYEISKQFVAKGIEVDVITNRNDNSSFEIKEGIRIFRVGNSIANYYKSKDNNFKKNGSKNLLNNIKTSIYSLLKIIHKYTWMKLYWPDFAFSWYFHGIRKSNSLMINRKYDKIITVSLPFTCHLIGLRLKQKYPDLFWLADSGDPFSFSDLASINNTSLYKNLNYKFENKVFQSSEKLTFTTQATVNRYSKLFPASLSKFVVIPPLVKLYKPKLKTINIFNKTKNDTIILSYFGVLYKDIRNPNGLLFMLDSLINSQNKLNFRIELHFFGDHTPCLDTFQEYSFLSKNITFHGSVSKEIALMSMHQSDILINIGNLTNYQLPSKIVEYVAVSKPIINIISIFDDSSKIYLNQFPFVLNYKINDDIAVVLNFIKNLKFIKIEKPLVQSFVLKHHPDMISNHYLKALMN